MTEFWSNFHFLRPWLLFLLLVPAVLYGLYFKGISAQSSWQKVIAPRLLEYLLVKGSAVKRRFFAGLSLLGLIVAALAAAGPSWQKIEMPSYMVQNPLMLVLNLSSDMKETDLSPSRLERAKYKIRDFLGLLKGVQAGLEVYSSEPFVIAPLTDDMNILTNLLPAVNFDIMPANGDRLDRAIELAVAKIKSAGFNSGRIVVFAPEVGQKFDLALAAAAKAKGEGFMVDIIGVAKSYSEKLAMIAQAGGGEYHNLQTDDRRIAALAGELNLQSGDLAAGDNKRTVWLDAGWYLLVIPLVCCLAMFRKGILTVVLLLSAGNAYAGFFFNDNQEGLKAFNSGEYQKAAASFTVPSWQGAAYYRAGDYRKALDSYRNDGSPEGLYNQGNALAKAGQIDEAIAKYKEVLSQNPDHEDAKFNLEYLQRQQQRQQKQNQQPNEDNQDNNQNDSQQQNQPAEPNQAQSADNRQSDEQSSQGEQNSEQQQQNQSAAQEQDGEQDKNSERQDELADTERSREVEELDKDSPQNEGENSGGALTGQGKADEEYDEKMQALARQYREIKEDAGGLLKAFIYQEYQKNRYNEQ